MGFKLGSALVNKSGETILQANRKIREATIKSLLDA